MPPTNHLDRALIGMEPLQEILETSFFTSALTESVPLSIMLIGPPGTGKSKVILQYYAESLHTTNDLTSQGLAELLEDDKENKLCHIIIPDFNIVVSHKSATSNLTVASLLTVMSEGSVRIDDGRRKKEVLHRPLGIVTGMTREMYEENAQRFRKLGIGRRFIPIHFSYGPGTRMKVQDSIKNGATTLAQLQKKKIILPPTKNWPINIEVPQIISDRLSILSRDMADALAVQPGWEKSYNGSGSNEIWKIVPVRGAPPIEFTPHMILRSMARAHALRAGRKVVKDTDLEFLIKFVPFINYGIPVML